MPQRMQSPSSINTFRQCPRRYFYRYVLRLPTSPSIHLIRGSVAHKVLEDFFTEPPGDDWRTELQRRALRLLAQYWEDANQEFSILGLPDAELHGYKEETQLMLIRWLAQFAERLSLLSEDMSVQDAFVRLTPVREAEYRDEELQVCGFIDAVETDSGAPVLIDYKTSKHAEITPEYRLQLGIYALLYLRHHQELPARVGIHFLRHHRETLVVDDDLLLEAQFAIEQVHMLTQSARMAEYPMQPGPLCNWCDFVGKCFPQGRNGRAAQHFRQESL